MVYGVVFFLLTALVAPVWAELGEFAKTGPEFLLKNGDYRQLAIVITVLVICWFGIRHALKNDDRDQFNPRG